MKASLQMRKLDIHTLRQAYEEKQLCHILHLLELNEIVQIAYLDIKTEDSFLSTSIHTTNALTVYGMLGHTKHWHYYYYQY